MPTQLSRHHNDRRNNLPSCLGAGDRRGRTWGRRTSRILQSIVKAIHRLRTTSNRRRRHRRVWTTTPSARRQGRFHRSISVQSTIPGLRGKARNQWPKLPSQPPSRRHRPPTSGKRATSFRVRPGATAVVKVVVLVSLLVYTLYLLVTLLCVQRARVRIGSGSISLRDILPVRAVARGTIVGKGNSVAINCQLLLPRIFALSRDRTRCVRRQLRTLLGVLPTNAIVRRRGFCCAKQCRRTRCSSGTLVTRGGHRFGNGRVLGDCAGLCIAFAGNDQGNGVHGDTSNASLVQGLRCPFGRPCGRCRRQLARVRTFLVGFRGNLSSVRRFRVHGVSSARLGGTVCSCIGLSCRAPRGSTARGDIGPVTIDRDKDVGVKRRRISVLSLAGRNRRLRRLTIPRANGSGTCKKGVRVPSDVQDGYSVLCPMKLNLPFGRVMGVIVRVASPSTAMATVNTRGSTLGCVAGFCPPTTRGRHRRTTFYSRVARFSCRATCATFGIILGSASHASLVQGATLMRRNFDFVGRDSYCIRGTRLYGLFFYGVPNGTETGCQNFIGAAGRTVYCLRGRKVCLSSRGKRVCRSHFNAPTGVGL